MAIKQIVQVPSEFLKQKSIEIGKMDAGIVQLAKDLTDTMNKHRALGLSAVQIGVPMRMFAVSRDIGCPFSIFMNPVILMTSEETFMSEEGCLSIGNGIPKFKVRRAKKLVIQAVAVSKKNAFKVKLDIIAKAAVVFQHEFDHLEGKLLTDVGVPLLLSA